VVGVVGVVGVVRVVGVVGVVGVGAAATQPAMMSGAQTERAAIDGRWRTERM
jgi:hypothetical protein